MFDTLLILLLTVHRRAFYGDRVHLDALALVAEYVREHGLGAEDDVSTVAEAVRVLEATEPWPSSGDWVTGRPEESSMCKPAKGGGRRRCGGVAGPGGPSSVFGCRWR